MMFVATIIVSLPFVAFGQQQDRIVDWQPVRTMSEAKVLEIVDIKVAGKPVTIGHAFTADEDWLNTLTFR
ncbi:MAG TPA: hypothetical protein VF507_09575, partial [Pyrinomonadaceae bacterium]